MRISGIIHDCFKFPSQDRYVVSLSQTSPLEKLLEHRVELAVFLGGNERELEIFLKAFEGEKLEGTGFRISQLKHYHGVYLAHTEDWQIYDDPHTHTGSDAKYLAVSEKQGMLLQSLEPHKQTSIHMHLGEEGSLKEIFWSLDGTFFQWVGNHFYGLSGSNWVALEVKDNRLYYNDHELQPGAPLPFQRNSMGLRVLANEVHQAGTGMRPALTLLWMKDLSEYHKPCDRGINIKELIGAYQL